MQTGVAPLIINHWLAGAITLAILLALMAALVSFGGGREHS